MVKIPKPKNQNPKNKKSQTVYTGIQKRPFFGGGQKWQFRRGEIHFAGEKRKERRKKKEEREKETLQV